MWLSFFFFNDTATTEIYTLSLHDALPISTPRRQYTAAETGGQSVADFFRTLLAARPPAVATAPAPARASTPQTPAETTGRSEEHTSELQSRQYLVCRLLLEKKKNTTQSLKQNTCFTRASLVCRSTFANGILSTRLRKSSKFIA